MTAPKVVGLRGAPVADGRTPDPKLVAELKNLLERAESGEIVGLAAVFQYWDDATGSSLTGIHGYSMIGRMERVKRHILRNMDNA